MAHETEALFSAIRDILADAAEEEPTGHPSKFGDLHQRVHALLREDQRVTQRDGDFVVRVEVKTRNEPAHKQGVERPVTSVSPPVPPAG